MNANQVSGSNRSSLPRTTRRPQGSTTDDGGERHEHPSPIDPGQRRRQPNDRQPRRQGARKGQGQGSPARGRRGNAPNCAARPGRRSRPPSPPHWAKNGARGLSSRARSRARLGALDVAHLHLQPGPHEPKLPIVAGALDRLAEVSVGGPQVAVELLDQGQLQPRAPPPRAEGWPRRGRSWAAEESSPALAASRLSVSRSSVKNWSPPAQIAAQPTTRVATPSPNREDAPPRGPPPLAVDRARDGAQERGAAKGRRPGEQGRGHHHQAEAGGQLPGPVDRRRGDPRGEDRQGGPQRPLAGPGGAAADPGDEREAEEAERPAPSRPPRARPSPR